MISCFILFKGLCYKLDTKISTSKPLCLYFVNSICFNPLSRKNIIVIYVLPLEINLSFGNLLICISVNLRLELSKKIMVSSKIFVLWIIIVCKTKGFGKDKILLSFF